MSEQYQKKELRQHIYDTPDTYAGGSDLINEVLPIYSKDDHKIIYKEIEYIPVLYNMFNEILVNARDHKIRLEGKNVSQVTNIKVTFEKDTNTWSIYNDGEGIPIEIHSKENVYNPELIFGHLLT